MAFDCRVYRILIASPSDVEEEREIAARVIQEWNDLYSYSRKVVLLPLRWETHTAPEYGTRPQEVINKAIVDHCDLLVGVFWTRIGSPTGKADSGTLEEIERVGLAGKPIMLYFSKVGIDPDKIDLTQIEKLKQFKEKTYPKGLVESYKSTIEFRDKFAKQLELKVRDLQKNEDTGEPPLALNFLSDEEDKLIGNVHHISINRPVVANFDAVPEDKRELIMNLIADKINRSTIIPITLAIDNSSSSGIRNLYVELDFSSSTKNSSLSDELEKPFTWNFPIIQQWLSSQTVFTDYTQHLPMPKHARFESEKLLKTDKGWRLSFDWDAIQPQRTRLIKPILYFSTSETATLSIQAKIFADSFPEPLLLNAEMIIKIEEKEAPIDEIFPNWAEFLEREKSKKP